MLSKIIEVCSECKMQQEKSIDKYIEALQAKDAEIEQLQQQTEAVKVFLDAMRPIIEKEEKLKGRQENKEICRLYREIYPEGVSE